LTQQLDNTLAKKIYINIVSILKKLKRTIDKLKKKKKKAKKSIQEKTI